MQDLRKTLNDVVNSEDLIVSIGWGTTLEFVICLAIFMGIMMVIDGTNSGSLLKIFGGALMSQQALRFAFWIGGPSGQ